MQAAWFSLGMLSLGVGLIGIALPLVPTTPLLLLAAFCFSRSSERLYHWLLSHRRFGRVIDDWRSRGAVNPRAKRLATVAILAVLGLSLILGVGAVIVAVQAITLGCVLLFIWTRPNY